MRQIIVIIILIVIVDLTYRIAKIFSYSDTITLVNTCAPSGKLFMKAGCVVPFSADFYKSFIGIKSQNSHGYIYIEKLAYNGIRVIEYRLNKTQNRPIICRQKE